MTPRVSLFHDVLAMAICCVTVTRVPGISCFGFVWGIGAGIIAKQEENNESPYSSHAATRLSFASIAVMGAMENAGAIAGLALAGMLTTITPSFLFNMKFPLVSLT